MIIDDFKEIMERFPIESKKPIKNNKLVNKMRNEFKKDFEYFVFDCLQIKANIQLKFLQVWEHGFLDHGWE